MATKVLVVGATSGVGLQVVKAMLAEAERFQVYALVRDQARAHAAIGYGASHVRFVRGDVTKPETLAAACRAMDVVVCTVGARHGWQLPCYNQQTPKFVDYRGVESLASACVAERVKKFVLVSSMGVTRPFWIVSIILNLFFGRVLHWKWMGEEALRKLFSAEHDFSYFIIRPGGLTKEDGGKKGIAIRQGDIAKGKISRADVATVAVACVEGKCPPNVTFDVVNSSDPSEIPPDHIEDLFQFVLPDARPELLYTPTEAERELPYTPTEEERER